MCLGDAAHGLEPNHEIFKTPLPVTLTFEDRPTPTSYREFARGRDLKDRLSCWKVQTTDYRQKECTFGAGVVTPGLGFEDSPDCEYIAGGLNTKGPESLAIGRHGPFFYWGFAAPPPSLAESARRALVNAVCYVHKFDRSPLLVRGVMQSRDRVMQIPFVFEQIPVWHEGLKEDEAAHQRKQAELKEAKKTRKLTDAEELELSMTWIVGTLEEFTKNQIENSVPKELFEKFGTDPEKYAVWAKDNLNWLRSGDYKITVDEDAQALGLPNDSIALLDRAIDGLSKNNDAARMRRILETSTGLKFPTAAAWKEWLDESRDDLFFSDVGGFKFISTRTSRESIVRRVHTRRLPDAPTPDDPVAIDVPDLAPRVRVGDLFPVVVRIRIAESWHIYGRVAEGQPYPPLAIDLDLPKGLRAVGPWNMPPLIPDRHGNGTIETEGIAIRWIKVDSAAPGRFSIGVNVSYQCCDHERCRPPEELSARLEMTVGEMICPPTPRK